MPARILLTLQERNRLIRFGAKLGKAMNELVTIVYCRLRGTSNSNAAMRGLGLLLCLRREAHELSAPADREILSHLSPAPGFGKRTHSSSKAKAEKQAGRSHCDVGDRMHVAAWWVAEALLSEGGAGRSSFLQRAAAESQCALGNVSTKVRSFGIPTLIDLRSRMLIATPMCLSVVSTFGTVFR
jgi:hypothetical protein